ncbi:LytTR family DNA-binding domain-containing protein [Pontixanthobacter sp.]|uniref:LytTR family DNA-binding domain-containing protein n=1 Tax=Pontixanthobacter sp. TaxID=2792078 RepID=UPI003C7ECCD6
MDRPLTNYIAEIGVIALAGLGLALLGPFGTDALPLGVRFLYWIGGLITAWAVFRLIVIAMREVTQLLGISDIFSYLLATPLLGGLILIVQSWLAHGSRSSLVQAELSIWSYLQTLGLGLVFFVLFWLIYYRAANHSARANTARPSDENARTKPAGLSNTLLHRKLPAGFGPIVALSVEDHYIRVHAFQHSVPAYSEMLLMKLSDAIALIGRDTGLQTHRSWWVAQPAVFGHTRNGRNITLTLPCGIKAPVSRRNVAKVRAAGWLD